MLTNTTARGAESFKAGTSWAKRGAVAAIEDNGFAPRVERERKSHKKVVQARRRYLSLEKPGSPKAGKRMPPEREDNGYVVERSEQHDREDSDLVLDVPVLNVDELDLEVEDLRAHVSLRAELADLVKVNVGVDAYLAKVKLEIKGVEAQVSLRVKLERVLNTLERALASIDKNPQILGGTARNQDQAVEGESRAAFDEEMRTTRRTADEPGGVTDAAPDESDSVVGEETARGLAALEIEEEYVDDRGRIVGRARDEFGNVVEEVLDDKGDVLNPSAPEEEEDRRAEDEDTGEVDATDAARRKAGELGVDLSEVRGTGSNSRVLVKDVERAARRSGA
jgi:hypothetical protein